MSEPPIAPDVDPGPVVTGWNDSPVTGDRIDVNENSFIAGDPAGARIEIRSTGFHAFNGTGTETAHIDGAEGVFVGGEFRTSDNLPGGVRIADDAFAYSGHTLPGIAITPEDTRHTVLPAGVGPWGTGAALRGGEDTSGRSSKIHATPTQAGITSTSPTGDAQMFASSSGISMGTTRTSDGLSGHLSVGYLGVNLGATDGTAGEVGEVTALPRDLRMTLRDVGGNITGQIRVVASTSSISSSDPDGRVTEISAAGRSGARISHTGTDGTVRQLQVTPNGIYLVTNPGNSEVRTNLETLASDVQDLKARVAALEA